MRSRYRGPRVVLSDGGVNIWRACEECHSTGVYVGALEEGGAGVVCDACHGAGVEHIEILGRSFTGRELRRDVTRVFPTHGDLDRLSPDVVGGKPYEEWLHDGHFGSGTEFRADMCPKQWAQWVDPSREPGWADCVGGGKAFENCPSYAGKESCWDRLDKEERIEAALESAGVIKKVEVESSCDSPSEFPELGKWGKATLDLVIRRLNKLQCDLLELVELLRDRTDHRTAATRWLERRARESETAPDTTSPDARREEWSS